jgi:hypothetical protein
LQSEQVHGLHGPISWKAVVPALNGAAYMMKTCLFWAMLLLDAYALFCIYLLLMLFAGAEMPPFTFTQIRS